MRKYYGIGVNDYPGVDNDLKGAVNDIILGRNQCFARGYGRENLQIYTDKAGTVEQLRNVFKDVDDTMRKSGGAFVFHFAGHGTYVPDKSGDEKDKLDESLVLHDFETAGLLLDDEFSELLHSIPKKVKAICIMDCCFSGGVSRFAGRYPGGTISNSLTYRNRHLRLPPSLASSLIEGELPYDNLPVVFRSDRGKTHRVKVPKNVVLFNAASENEPAADAYLRDANKNRGAHHGAFTYCLFEALFEANYSISYTELLAKTTAKIRQRGFVQTPTLEGDPEELSQKWAG